MTFADIIFLGIGLSMDAFAVALTNGMSKKNIELKMTTLIAFAFGFFQGLMPVFGYFLGNTFSKQISSFDHWIALILLGYIGTKMIIDSRKKDDASQGSLKISELFLQGIATSIDAFAVGVSLAALNVNIFLSASIIAITTFVLSFIAVFIGKKSGSFLKDKAQLTGGLILVIIGVKIFVEHIFFG